VLRQAGGERTKRGRRQRRNPGREIVGEEHLPRALEEADDVGLVGVEPRLRRKEAPQIIGKKAPSGARIESAV
jgi:hypothetical protein